jgi:inner membrane transporter RhtA
VWAGQPLGVVFAFANAALFAAYIVLGHRAAQHGTMAGVDALACSMLVAAIVVTPISAVPALPALTNPTTLLAGVGIGVSSSLIPYVTDQFAMARIKRSTYALLTSLLPATASVVGLVVLRQLPTAIEAAGIVCVIAAVALHRDKEAM